MQKRLFIGIPLTKILQPIYCNIQSAIGSDQKYIKWIPIENLHLTVLFLGNTKSDAISTLISSVNNLFNISNIPLIIEHTGIFTKNNLPKILWLGIKDHKHTLFKIHKQLKNTIHCFNKNDVKDEFIPHVTVGKIRSSNSKINVLPFLKHVYSPMELKVNSMVLYQSHLLPQGVKYKVLHNFPLN